MHLDIHAKRTLKLGSIWTLKLPCSNWCSEMNFAGWLFMQTNRSVLVDFTWYLACWYTCHIMNEMTIQFCLPIRQAAGHLFSYHAEWSWHTNLISNDRTDLRARRFRANWRWACLNGCIIQIWFHMPANIIRWSYWTRRTQCLSELAHKQIIWLTAWVISIWSAYLIHLLIHRIAQWPAFICFQDEHLRLVNLIQDERGESYKVELTLGSHDKRSLVDVQNWACVIQI
jgi:hypothetical protein